jgi:uncharacterized protein
VLRSFRLANHRSFRDEHELLLMPAYSKDRDVLPVAAIYGANASGKSSLLDGLKFMADAVQHSFAAWVPRQPVPRKQFVLDMNDQPSIYVVELVIDGVRHTYGFEIDDREVREEWLYSYPEARKRVLFERDQRGVRFGSTVTERSKLDLLSDLLRPNALFLSLAAQSAVDHVLPVWTWFVEKLHFRLESGSGVDQGRIVDFLADNPEDHDRVVDLLQAADLGVSGLVALRGTSRDGTPRRKIYLEHGPGDMILPLEDESAGTRSWLSLLPVALTVLRGGGALVIDEIDASLHPLLAARLIALFNEQETNVGGAQLIFTSHDATLLHPPLGDEVLRRDEVWFVEKDRESGASTLYPLTDFKPRGEDNLERRYLAGRYGAIPDMSEDRFTNAIRGLSGEA